MAKLTIILVAWVTVAFGSPSQPQIDVKHWQDGVQIDVSVPTDARNRLINVAWQSLDEHGPAGSSTKELQGEDSPSVVTVPVRTLPQGHYLAVASIYAADGKLINGTRREFYR